MDVGFDQQFLGRWSMRAAVMDGLAEQAVALCAAAVDSAGDAFERRDEIFGRLDALLVEANDRAIQSILRDRRYRTLRGILHRTRATYEYERELRLARAVVRAGSERPVSAFRSARWYEAATDFELRALTPYRPRRMLFVGAGPFPISVFSYLRAAPEISVTCLDQNRRAADTAREVATVYGFPGLDVVELDVLEFTNFSEFDCVVVGLVVGISACEKRRVCAHLRRWAPEQTLLAFRTAVGCGTVIYPSMDLSGFRTFGYRVLPDPPHRSFTLVIPRRRGA